MALSSLLGVLMTYSTVLCNSYNSPLATSITGNTKDIVSTLIGSSHLSLALWVSLSLAFLAVSRLPALCLQAGRCLAASSSPFGRYRASSCPSLALAGTRTSS
jgi:hypothetical protein